MRRRGDIGRALRERLGPLLIWLGACAAIVVLWADVSLPGPVQGFATRTDVAVAALAPGRVVEVLVAPGDRVVAGQIVATLDPAAVESELRVVEAERAQIEADLLRVQAEARRATFGDAADSEDAVADADREVRSARAELEGKRAELRATEGELTRMRDLVARRLLTEQELSGLVVQRARLREEIREGRATVALLEEQAAAVRARAERDGDSDLVATATAALQSALRVADARLLLLRAQREDLVLRAPAGGQVSEVLARPGEATDLELPVARVALDNRGRVTACVDEEQLALAVLGGAVEVSSSPDGGQRWPGRTVVLGPVGELPERCWPNPAEPRWGRAVEIELDAPTTLVPGAPLTVRFLDEPPARAGAARSGVAAPT